MGGKAPCANTVDQLASMYESYHFSPCVVQGLHHKIMLYSRWKYLRSIGSLWTGDFVSFLAHQMVTMYAQIAQDRYPKSDALSPVHKLPLAPFTHPHTLINL